MSKENLGRVHLNYLLPEMNALYEKAQEFMQNCNRLKGIHDVYTHPPTSAATATQDSLQNFERLRAVLDANAFKIKEIIYGHLFHFQALEDSVVPHMSAAQREDLRERKYEVIALQKYVQALCREVDPILRDYGTELSMDITQEDIDGFPSLSQHRITHTQRVLVDLKDNIDDLSDISIAFQVTFESMTEGAGGSSAGGGSQEDGANNQSDGIWEQDRRDGTLEQRVSIKGYVEVIDELLDRLDYWRATRRSPCSRGGPEGVSKMRELVKEGADLRETFERLCEGVEGYMALCEDRLREMGSG